MNTDFVKQVVAWMEGGPLPPGCGYKTVKPRACAHCKKRRICFSFNDAPYACKTCTRKNRTPTPSTRETINE